MFKTLITLFRGAAAVTGEHIADQNALLILDQQVRDATSTFERAKKALALAIAQDQQEGLRLNTINAQINDLEVRVNAALEAGNEALSLEGAQAIADLEADRDATLTARSLFASEISRLRHHVKQAQNRIAAVDRGRKIARAAEAVRHTRRGRIEAAMPHACTLAEAEATLKRLRERQIEFQAADEALDEIDASTAPITAAQRLSAQGFGPRINTTAEDVLLRLKSKSLKIHATI